MNTKLKPCPFCGKIPMLWDEEDPHYPGGPVVTGHYLECKCGIKMYGYNLDESDLIKTWNKRIK